MESSSDINLGVTRNANSSKKLAEITTVETNLGLNSSWQMIYNEIIKIRQLTIETSKFLSPVLLMSLMVDLSNIVYYVSHAFKLVIHFQIFNMSLVTEINSFILLD